MGILLKSLLAALVAVGVFGLVELWRMRSAVLSLSESGTLWTLCPSCARFVPLNHAAVEVGFIAMSCPFCETLYPIATGVKEFMDVNGIPTQANGEVMADESGRAIPMDPAKPAPTDRKTAVMANGARRD